MKITYQVRNLKKIIALLKQFDYGVFGISQVLHITSTDLEQNRIDSNKTIMKREHVPISEVLESPVFDNTPENFNSAELDIYLGIIDAKQLMDALDNVRTSDRVDLIMQVQYVQATGIWLCTEFEFVTKQVKFKFPCATPDKFNIIDSLKRIVPINNFSEQIDKLSELTDHFYSFNLDSEEMKKIKKFAALNTMNEHLMFYLNADRKPIIADSDLFVFAAEQSPTFIQDTLDIDELCRTPVCIAKNNQFSTLNFDIPYTVSVCREKIVFTSPDNVKNVSVFPRSIMSKY